MKAAERESPFQVALITQATDLRDLFAVDARRRDVRFVVHCGERKATNMGSSVLRTPLTIQKEVDRANHNDVTINCSKQSTHKTNICHFHAGAISWLRKKAAKA
jgi:hypothetical protein